MASIGQIQQNFKVQGNCIYYEGKKGDGVYHPELDPANNVNHDS